MNQNVLPARRPTSETELEAISRKAHDFAKKGQYEEALLICEWLLEESSTQVAGLRRRASVFEQSGNLEQAIEDLEGILTLGIEEPADMYQLGLLYLQACRHIEAEIVLSKAVRVSLHEGFSYYLNSCRLLRAEALLRQRRGREALAELAEVPKGFSVYVYGSGNRTQEGMTAEAQAMN
ncbi:tetratricopeptide repeat protein [Piscinibacter sp.]|uniref:tetratricopeptide repeat protein n=1 Tax=Piscinibacter sp. TaxID=1903157 RepID=UPI0039E53C5F